MSRSWERKVRKNTTVLNKTRKKMGVGAVTGKAKVEKFKGRNYILPGFIILFTGFYVYMATLSMEWKNNSTMFLVTIGSYMLLAALFFFRRPYLSVAKDYLGTRRMTGDKTLFANNIKKISLQKGFVVIEQTKGQNWVFSKIMNRFPTDRIAERLRTFANENGITLDEK
jgi:hypothetical protein